MIAGGLLVSMLGLLIGTPWALFGEALAICGVFRVMARHARPLSPVGLYVLVTLYLLFMIYLVDTVIAPFPGAYAFLLGIRKSMIPWLFVGCGVLATTALRSRLQRCVSLMLLGACVVSLVMHHFAPGLEAQVVRHADTYTSLFAGRARLQGVFSGPFHAAMAGAYLAVLGLTSPTISKRLTLVFVAVGLGVMIDASVRTAWVSLAVGLLAFGLSGPSGLLRLVTWPRAFAASAVIAAIAVAGATMKAAPTMRVISSVAAWRTDARLLNRLPSYRTAWSMFSERPVTGWGAGTAGDTMQRFFPAGGHVTSHNLAVKFAIEAGTLGVGLILALLLVIVVVLWLRPSRESRSTLAVAGMFLAFGATGSAVDAAPVSWAVLLAIGIGVNYATHASSHGVQRDASEGGPPTNRSSCGSRRRSKR